MQKDKPEIIFVVENKMGGIAYLNKNIINSTSRKNEAWVKVILLNQIDANHARFTDTFEADEIIDFRYAGYENKYAVLKRLHKQLGSRPGAVICNDSLEMEAIYLLGTPKTVYQIIHDFYNLKLAVRYGAITDVFIAHTKLFRDVLISADPSNIDARFLPHGVPIPAIGPIEESGGNLKIVYTGRLVESKGIRDLYSIHKLLQKRGIDIEWTIIGRGPLRDFLNEQWKGENNVRFLSPDTNEEVMMLMSQHSLFVLPTRFEGSPVTILEALGTGIAPVVSDLPGGIREIVSEDIGRRVPVGNIELFADAIAELHCDRKMLYELRINARKLALQQFDIKVTSDNYFEAFVQFASLKKPRQTLPKMKFGSRLDNKWLPNAAVCFFRRLFL